jgi:hypothetical protein
VLADETAGGARMWLWNGTDSGGKVVTSGIYFGVSRLKGTPHAEAGVAQIT